MPIKFQHFCQKECLIQNIFLVWLDTGLQGCHLQKNCDLSNNPVIVSFKLKSELLNMVPGTQSVTGGQTN